MHGVKCRHVADTFMYENFYNALTWTSCVAH